MRTISAYDEPEHVRLTLANSIRDTADTLVYIDKAVTGGASSSSAGYVGGGGSGISPANVLDMLKKTDMHFSKYDAWAEQAGIKIESNSAEIYAAKTAIVGGFGGDVENINAAIKATTDGGGLVSIKVSKNDVISCINQTPENITIDAKKIDLKGYVTIETFESKVGQSALLSVGTLTAKSVTAKESMYLGSKKIYATESNFVTSVSCVPQYTVVKNNEGITKSVVTDPGLTVTKTKIKYLTWSEASDN